MRKALILVIAVLLLLAVSIKVPGNITGFALEVPEGDVVCHQHQRGQEAAAYGPHLPPGDGPKDRREAR